MSERKKRRKRKAKLWIALLIILLVLAAFVFVYLKTPFGNYIDNKLSDEKKEESFLSQIPEYDGIPYVEVNGNIPYFTESDITTEPFEKYAELDKYGRCGVAYANLCKDIMPIEEREEINSVTPTGWLNNRYDIVDQEYLYNRCHLIAFQLAGENANEKNLITGTRYMNVEGMLPFEDKVASYIYQTNNHVLYRVSPVFDGNNLVVSGVEIEAKSVEDNGEGVCFNVYVYNVQPGIEIDYRTGENWKGKDYEKYQ